MVFSAQQSATVTLVASTQQTLTFGYSGNNTPIRYAYVAVDNTTSATTVYVRTDGSNATVGGDFTTAVPGGTIGVVANQLPLWTQTASVIPVGTYPAGEPIGSGTPAEIQPLGSSLSGYAQSASPGTNVSVISSGTPTVTISGTG